MNRNPHDGSGPPPTPTLSRSRPAAYDTPGACSRCKHYHDMDSWLSPARRRTSPIPLRISAAIVARKASIDALALQRAEVAESTLLKVHFSIEQSLSPGTCGAAAILLSCCDIVLRTPASLLWKTRAVGSVHRMRSTASFRINTSHDLMYPWMRYYDWQGCVSNGQQLWCYILLPEALLFRALLMSACLHVVACSFLPA